MSNSMTIQKARGIVARILEKNYYNLSPLAKEAISFIVSQQVEQERINGVLNQELQQSAILYSTNERATKALEIMQQIKEFVQ